MPKKPDLGAKLYAFMTSEGATWTVAAIAKQFNLRAPLVTHYTVEYCVKNGLPLPAFRLVSDKQKTKKLRRGSQLRDLRISQLSLERVGLGDEMRFKLVFDTERQAIILLPEASKAESLEDLLNPSALESENPTEESEEEIVEVAPIPSKSKLKALRPPRPKKAKTTSFKA